MSSSGTRWRGCSIGLPWLLVLLLTGALGQRAARAEDAVGFVEVDENAERRARASELLHRGRYTEALDVYRAAHAWHRQPSLLYLIGCTAQLAGRATLAEHYFRRYLEDAPDAPPGRRADAARRLARLRELFDAGRTQWTPEALAAGRDRREAEAQIAALEAEQQAALDAELDPPPRRHVSNGALNSGVVFFAVSRFVLSLSGGLILQSESSLWSRPDTV